MNPRNNPFTVASLLSVASLTSICAAPLYWKTSTAAAWTSATWATSPGGTYDQPWVAGSDVIFEDNLGTALTITGAATDFASITANENVTVTPGGTLGTGGTMAIVDVASGKTLNFAAQAISTAAGTGFVKNGAGIWSLANAGAYPGGFTLNAGTVAVGNANALGSGGALVINGGTIRSNDGTARNLGGKFSSITLGGNVTLGDTVSNGALTFNTNTSLGAATRTLAVNSAVTHTGIISGGAGVGIVKTGPGLLTLGGANTYTGTTSISNGVVSIATTGAIPGFATNGSYSVASGAGLAVANAVTDANIASMLGTTNFAGGSAIGFDTTAASRAYAVVLANTAQGSLGLVKEGANTLTLSTANTYTGGTTVNAGTVALSNATALGSGAVQVNGGATVTVNASLDVSNAVTLKRGTASRAQIILGSTNTGSTWSGNITVDNSNAVNNNFAAIQAGGNSAAVASVVSGNIGYSVLGGAGSATSQSLVLRTTDRFGKVTGSISLAEGYLQMLDSTKWEFSNTSNTWGTLDVSHAGAIATVGATNTLSPSGVVYSNVAGTLLLNNQLATTAYNQTIAGLGGNVKVGLLAGAATLTLNTSSDQSGSGVISGNISLVKSGAAKQTLTGANTYTGSTTINGGTLALGTTGTLSTGDLAISNATLDLRKGSANRTQTVNNLTLSGATLNIGLNASADQIEALGTTTVNGTNTLKLHGSVPTGVYNLITTQSALSGTFVLDTSGVTPSGFPTAYSGAIQGNSYVLTVTGAATPLTAYWRGDVSSVWSDSSAAPNSNWATDVTGTSDTGQIAGAITEVHFSATNAANKNTTLGADTSIYGLIFDENSGAATVGGANTLTILNDLGFGIDVFPGADATLSTGGIVCIATAAVQAGGTLTVNSGGLGSGPLVVDGILNLNMNVTQSSLGGLNTGVISRGIAGAGVLTVSTAANSLYEGAINNGAGTMALVKGGTVTPSTLTLSGTSDYTGGTTITGGILQANSSTALGSGTVAINGGQRLGLGDGVTLANAITVGANSSPQGNGLITAFPAASSTTTVTGPISITSAAAGGGHFVNSGVGTFDVKSVITSTVPVTHRSGTITYWGAVGTSYTAMSVTAGTARLAANNGLSPTATLTMGQSGASTLDLAGFNQTLVGITRFTPNPFAATIGNSSTATDSVLTTTGTSVFDGVIANAVSGGTRTTGLTVSSGALTLSGVNTYTGNTTIGTGAGLTLSDNAQLRFSIGVVSNSISGTGSAFINGDFNIDTTVSEAGPATSGTWNLETLGASSVYDTTFQVLSGTTPWTATGDVWTKTVGTKSYSFDEATGVLTMTTVSGGFDAWATSKGLAGGDAAFDADPDFDGIDNGLEFVLGGEPNPANPGSSSTALLPTVSQTGGNLTFTFKRKDLSESGVVLTFQWSTNLVFPSPANDVPVGQVDSTTDTITVDVTEDAPDADTDTIAITIPAAKAVGGKLFGRLSAVKVP
ncbi:autotransporter-associated beta strand repeat-containing protein [Luteolibacter arcticus]|uniref:Autotransporter-associated beta strand repeat-containing protein n=1 Tax=Luteolibacter arcticus TaxID=1581411 RepID=A0ABT3GNH7_9BACT|nr:autotransporter-associated beta strand repeat-containing protein [Luteolibacter arcticus]MCW1925069.1 autotransporter-associated beta strand repeat-containing protein [Luteolibacter arcticus]